MHDFIYLIKKFPQHFYKCVIDNTDLFTSNPFTETHYVYAIDRYE